MPYTPTVWLTGDIITAAKANNWETQYGYGSSELTTHKGTTDIDHPAGSVGDTAIGNRTVTDASTATGNTGALTDFLGWLANKAKAMQGSTAWTDAPAVTLADVSSHIAATTFAHGGLTPATHVGAGGAEHAAATTAAAGFMAAVDKQMLTGGGLVMANCAMTMLNCGTSGYLVGVAGAASTAIGRYAVGTGMYTENAHGLTGSAIHDIVDDSTYAYLLWYSSSGALPVYGLRRVHLASSSQTDLAALSDATYGAQSPSLCPYLRAAYNGADYIYAVCSWHSTGLNVYSLRVCRYSIASSAWTVLTTAASTSGYIYARSAAYMANQQLWYTYAPGSLVPVVKTWNEAASSDAGVATLFLGSAIYSPVYAWGRGDYIAFLSLHSGSTHAHFAGLLNTASTAWYMRFVPTPLVTDPNQGAFTLGQCYWVDTVGGALYVWPFAVV